MLDDNLKLWLIEINSSPSLSASSFEDYELKFGLLWDTFDVVDLEKKRTGKEFRVGGYDLIWNEDETFFKNNPYYPKSAASNQNDHHSSHSGQKGGGGEDTDQSNQGQSSYGTFGKSKNTKSNKENKFESEAMNLLSNHSIHADPLVHNSQFFKNLPSYPTNNYCGCGYDRTRIVLED